MRNQLKVTTPSDREIVMERTFDAPRDLVWDAMTKPEFIRRWLFSPPGWTMTRCDEDVRPGGEFHWAWSNAEGPAMTMHGSYSEVVRPERMVRTEIFDMGCQLQAAGQECTLVLDERAGKTHMTLTVVYPTKEARDGMIASGMELGVSTGYDQLEAMLVGA